MKKTIYLLALAAICTVLSLNSCVKDVIYNTPYPDHGTIIISADWSARGDEVAEPSEWMLTMGDYSGSETGKTHAPDHLFAPGTYTLVTWNPSEHITVNGTTATVAAATTTTASITVDLIENTPGWLMTNVQELVIICDSTHTRTAVMEQQVRQLTINIEPTDDAKDRVTGIDAYLSGVAGTMDFATGSLSAASNVELDFSKDDSGIWTATVRLLGVTGSEQRLTGTVHFIDNNPLDMALDSDMTAALADFNGDRRSPLSLGGTMRTPTDVDVTADIVDWEIIDNGSIDIH